MLGQKSRLGTVPHDLGIILRLHSPLRNGASLLGLNNPCSVLQAIKSVCRNAHCSMQLCSLSGCICSEQGRCQSPPGILRLGIAHLGMTSHNFYQKKFFWPAVDMSLSFDSLTLRILSVKEALTCPFRMN